MLARWRHVSAARDDPPVRRSLSAYGGIRSMQRIKLGALLFVCLALIVGTLTPASAGPLMGKAGPYRVEVTTDPSPVPVGPATIRVHLMDAAGKPVAGADIHVLAQMPGMPMGERQETAAPVAG